MTKPSRHAPFGFARRSAANYAALVMDPQLLMQRARIRSRQIRKYPLVRKVKARKRARDASPYVYTDSPTVSLVIQSFNHRRNIERIVAALRRTEGDELIVCEDGSVDGSEKEWRRHLTRPNDFLIQTNDLHEIRTYNRAISLARGEFVAVLQDDDIPPENPEWVADAVTLFRKYPKLAVLGCWNSWKFDFEDFGRSIGSAVGPGGDADESVRGISLMDPESKLPFAFVDAVGIGPVFFRRTDFEALGGFDLQLSGPGEPGIWLDYDICLRAWVSGRYVGAYESDAFERNIGGQGTVMFANPTRMHNYQKNRKHIDRTFAHRIDSVHRTVDDLNQGLVRRTFPADRLHSLSSTGDQGLSYGAEIGPDGAPANSLPT